jgi:murein L,D-transpeptidase YcbB/YkuD
MRDALARYRAIRDEGGWPQLPDGPSMRRDSATGPIALLHRRLAIEGYVGPAGGAGPPSFDEALETAVIAFQHTHGLNEDGIVGPATRAELDVTVDQRIDALRVNMERARWVLPGLADRFVAVNIAGQKVYYIENGQTVFETRAIVGTSYTRTPVFADTMRYIVINPTWTVPRSISRETLAGIRSDPDYLATNRIVVIDRAENRVDPSTIDFGAYTADTFPWVFRQLPGPLNALGRIKFMFPNRYDVYLHDTPSRSLFEREVRTFSHGCIRVENPFRLAELVLAGQAGGDQASLMRVVASDRTGTVQLERPIPVLILYWTASADLHGEIHFYRDIYGRDGAVLNALATPAGR